MRKEIEFESIEPINIKEERSELRGKEFLNIFDNVYYIVKYQLDKCIKHGIKGFIFYGDVGVGKTYCGKALAKELRVPLYFIDGKDIARSAYGESENRINHLFHAATLEKSIILIDDVESIFPKREWIKGQEWNVALSNVFFHEVDNLDTSKNCVILSTNKFDLVDKAVKDRLYPIKFPYPDLATLEETAKKRCSELLISSDEIIKNLKELFAGDSNGTKMDPIDEVARMIVSEDIDPSSITIPK